MSEVLPPLDPRVVQSRRVICEAALLEFAERGFDGMTIEGVAGRAGVGKSTIYRHWSSRSDLLESAIQTMPAFIDAGHERNHGSADTRTRVVHHLTLLDEALNSPPWGDVLPSLIHAAQRNEEMRGIHTRFSTERRGAFYAILAEGVEAGDLEPTADLEVLTAALASRVFMARLMQHTPLNADGIERLVDALVPFRQPDGP